MPDPTLRGYAVYGHDRMECALLVFAPTARIARGMSWRTIVHEYMAADEYIEVTAKWAKDADPKVWGVTEPKVIEPESCAACEMWYSTTPIEPGGMCEFCQEEYAEYGDD